MNQAPREDTEQQVKRRADEWADAERRGDTAFLKRTLADDFIGIGPRGFMLTKDEWLRRLASGALRYDTFTLEDVQVRAYGEAAVLTGREAQTGRYQGQDIAGQFRTTMVWVRQQGEWRLASLQLSPIAPPPPPASAPGQVSDRQQR